MSNTVFYIVVAIIIIHFVIGVVFLVRKLGGPVSEEPIDDQNGSTETSDVTVD